MDGPSRVANLRVQDHCPARPVEDLQVGTSDPIAAAYVFDALLHDGPARVERVDRNVCLRAFMSGVNRVGYPTNMGAAATALSTNIAFAPKVASEPPLRCYVFRHGCG